MRYVYLVLALFAAAAAGSVYWHVSTVTCPQHSQVFEKIGSNCLFFFTIICIGMLLVAAYYFLQFLFPAHKRHRN